MGSHGEDEPLSGNSHGIEIKALQCSVVVFFFSFTRYLGTGSSSRSGMALLEIGLLSGFSLSPSFVALGNPVKKVEEDEGKVYLYLDSVSQNTQGYLE